MDLKAEVERIRSTIVPLGRAGAVAQNPALRKAIIDTTSFLLPTATLTERMHCIAHEITELPMCTACHIKPAPWSPHKQLYRPSCSPTCAAVLKPIKERKQRQKELEESFVLPELTMEGFDRLYAANFLRENCLRKDGQLNGNLTQTPRNFVAMFGETEFVKVMSDYHLNHSGVDFALYAYTLDREPPLCEQCGENPTKFDSYKDGFFRTCSTDCGNNLAEKKQTIREKLLDPSEEILQRRHETNDRFMVQSIEKQFAEIKQEGKYELLDVILRDETERGFLQYSALRYDFRCLTCSNTFDSDFCRRRCFVCDPMTFKLELKIAENFPTNLYRLKQKSLLANKRLEIDVFFPDTRVGIEADGCFWHSYGSGDEEEVGKHFEKFRQCEDAGINLLSIIDLEWNDPVKQLAFLSMVNSATGLSRSISANDCDLLRPSQDEVNRFLEECHVKGYRSFEDALALQDKDGKLVAVMTIGNPRYKVGADLEIYRYAQALNTRVKDGFEMLLDGFAMLHPGKKIVGKSDHRMGTNSLFRSAGFGLHTVGEPSYCWVKGQKLHHTRSMSHHVLKKSLPTFDDDKSVSDNLFASGYRRLWDYGKSIFVKKL